METKIISKEKALEKLRSNKIYGVMFITGEDVKSTGIFIELKDYNIIENVNDLIISEGNVDIEINKTDDFYSLQKGNTLKIVFENSVVNFSLKEE